ncbi:hypothetical protein ASE23_24115 [Rhizobium sp. Root73]|uniref:hypothetical protein n=1 Tax=unclassified Rhizobium TaxID=2613769 RepID=UPI000726BDCA|nr:MULTISPECIES: hypothetical protein [unclassified Rhizobium]KQX98731.1 hypothetical protein ASD36_21735 [Rhizobium sp. Root1334]KRC10639.1 hypothetical protein ASE23_24115 [Rhizobium sp. Root73]
MFTSFVTIVVVAFIIGAALGLGANADDRKKLKDAEKRFADLRSALEEKQLEVDQSRRMHQKSISIAYSVVLDYETIFDELKKRNQSNRSAVILPFK